MGKSKKRMRLIAWLLAVVLAGSGMIPSTGVSAAKKPKLNKKKATITVGKTVKLKVKHKKKSVKWSSSNKKVATVNGSGRVKGKKKGKATITAKTGGRKLKCKVTVKAKKTNKDDADETDAPQNPKPSSPSVPGTTPGGKTPTPEPSGMESQQPGSTDTDTTASPTAPVVESETPSETDPAETTEPPLKTSSPTPIPTPNETPSSGGVEFATSTPRAELKEDPTPTPVPAYQVTIKVRIDNGVQSDSNRKFFLKKSGQGNYEPGLQVEDGTYRIYEQNADYEEDLDTQVDVTVSGQDAEAYVDYYTLSFIDDSEGQRKLMRPMETLLKGTVIYEPTDYEGKAGKRLVKWVTNDDRNNAFIFGQGIASKTELYADWEDDATVVGYSIYRYLEKVDGGYDEGNPTTIISATGKLNETVRKPETLNGFTFDQGRSDDPENTRPDQSGNTVVRYYYTRNSYKLTWKADGGTIQGIQGTQIAPDQLQCELKYQAQITKPTRDNVSKVGYNFYNWTGTDSMWDTMPSKNLEYTATYTAETYHIQAVPELREGDLAEGDKWPWTYTIESGTIKIPNRLKQGYTFDGWTENTEGGQPQKDVTIPAGSHENKTYYSHFTPNKDTPYIVRHRYEDVNGSYDTDISEDKLKGETDSEVTPALKGRDHFISPTEVKGKIAADGSTVFKYDYVRKSYTLRWEEAGGTIHDTAGTYTASGPVKYQKEITAPKNVTRNGYSFEGWKEGNGNGSATLMPGGFKTNMPGGDMTYTANWKAISYNITYYDSDEKTQITSWSDSNAVKRTYTIADTPCTLPTPKKDGYTFTGWKDKKTNTIIKAIPEGSTGDLTLIAQWDAVSYTITYKDEDGKEITNWAGTKGKTTYKTTDADYTLPTPAKTGYTFKNWTEEGSGAEVKVLSAGSKGNRTYIAHWTLTPTPTPEVTPTPEPVSSYTVTLTVQKDGTSWAAADHGKDFALYDRNDDDRSLVATFENNKATVEKTGTYYLYEGREYIEQVAVTGATTAKTIDYYTMTYQLQNDSYDFIDDDVDVSYSIVLRKGTAIPEPMEEKLGGYEFIVWYSSPNGVYTSVVEWGEDEDPLIISDTTTYYGYTTGLRLYFAYLELDGGHLKGMSEETGGEEEIGKNAWAGYEDNWYVKYTVQSDAITIPEPQKDGYTFAGWIGDNGNTPNKTVTIPAGSQGTRNYEAKWESNGGSGSGPGETTGGGASSSQTRPGAGASNTLTVGKIAVTLGMSKSQVETAAGGKPDRIEKSPLGFDVYIYNPSGDYTNYMMLQFNGNKLVGMTTLSAYFTYESLLTSGVDTVSTLTTKGFTRMSGYDYEKGYQYTRGDDEYVLAFIDHQGSGYLYAVEIFDKSLGSLDDLFKAENCKYDDQIDKYMAQQLFDWACAFRATKKLPLFVADKDKNGAQKHSDDMAKNNFVGTDSSNGTKRKTRFENEYPDYFGSAECVAGRSPDAFGVITWLLDDTSDTQPYVYLTKTVMSDYSSIKKYYLNTGFSHSSSGQITYAALDLYYYD